MYEHATRLAVLASGDRESGGGGSTMQRVIEDTQNGILDAEVGLVICNNPPGTVGVYDRVDNLNDKYGLDIEVVTINSARYPGGPQERVITLEESLTICEAMSIKGIERALCLGYMKALNGEFVDEFGWQPEYSAMPLNTGIYMARIVNTHPGILPETADTHGLGASEKALELALTEGLTETAHTLHVVGAGIDTGPTIAQHEVPIDTERSAEDLFDEVQAVEKAMIGQALNKYYQAQKMFDRYRPHYADLVTDLTESSK